MGRKKTERVALTENRIAHLPIPAKRRILYDEKEPDLGLKLEPTGTRTFFWFHAVAGKPMWRTIGPYPAVTLDDARTAARKFTLQNAEFRRANYSTPSPFAKPVVKRTLTLDELVDAYCEQHIPKKTLDPEFAAHTVRITVARCFPDWRSKQIDAISHADVTARHAKLGKERGPSAANRSVALLQRLYGWATGIGALYKGENPAKLYKEEKFTEHPRTRFLDPEEVVRFEAAVEREPNRDLRDFLALCLFTGLRKMEILTARWSDMQLERARWSVPRERRKNRQPHVVLLTQDALRILLARRAQRDETNPWVFPGGTAEGHRGDFGRPWKRVRAHAGLDSADPALRVTKHSLRHTNISYVLMAGRSIAEAAAASGHRAHDMVERYGHLLDETVRETVAAGEAKRHEMMAKARKRLPASAKK
jgi:integrase